MPSREGPSWDEAERDLGITLNEVVAKSILSKLSSEDNQRSYSKLVNNLGEILNTSGIDSSLVEDLEHRLNDGVFVKSEIEEYNKIFQALPLSLNQIKELTGRLNLGCSNVVFPDDNSQHYYSQRQLQSLQDYIQSSTTEFSGAVAVFQPHLEENSRDLEVASDQAHEDKIYNIASVAKIFTGLLPLVLVKEGIIEEEYLNRKGVEIPREVIDKFPAEVRENIEAQLEDITLHQLMTHRAGFGNFSQAYRQEMAEYLDSGQTPPQYDDHNQLLKFSLGEEGKLTSPGESRYSNVGMVILAAAVQQLYNKKNGGPPLAYNDIQERELLEKAGAQIHYRAPDAACYSDGDRIASNFLASPAGCAWMTPGDLVKFGQHVTELYHDKDMKELIIKYGQEFFDSESETISHRGDLPGEPGANAHFSVSLDSGEVFAAVSDKPNLASNLYYFALEQIGRENTASQVSQEQHEEDEAPSSLCVRI